MNIKLLQLATTSFDVRRFHTQPVMMREETVGHHTAGVISILFCLTDQQPSLDLIQMALYHDAPEAITGDIPATAKWDFPLLKDELEKSEEEIYAAAGLDVTLSPPDRALLKFADMMHLVSKAHMEVMCGNVTMLSVRHNGIEACLEILKGPFMKDNENAQRFFEYVLKGMQDASE